jgi:hypothetical protein
MRRLILGLVAISLVLGAVVASAALLLGGGTVALEPGDPPDTYMDPIPDYINANYADNFVWITGTSIAAPSRVIDNVEVQIIRNFDGYRWNDVGGMWTNDPNLWNDATVDVIPWSSNQWDWEYTGGTLPTSADFQSGLSYTVKARAEDDDGYLDLSPPEDTFIYDDADPDVSFTTVFPGTIYDELDTIEGTASDDDGELDQVRVMIQNTDDTTYWNGLWWQPTPDSVWLMTDGTLNWEISRSTNPALPQWYHNTNYEIDAQAADKADNRDLNMEGPRTFLFRKTLTASSTKPGIHMDPIPEWTNALAGFSGTSKAIATRTITDVRVLIQDKTEDPDMWWDETLGDWNTTKPVWPRNIGGMSAAVDAWGQQDWNFAIPADPDFLWKNNHEYSIQAWCIDSAVPGKEATTSTQTFTYNDVDPASVIDAFDVIVYNHWGSLTGVAEDGVGGEIGMVVVLIQRLSDSLYWNGAGWGAVEWNNVAGDWWEWVFAAAQDGIYDEYQEGWEVTSSTAQEQPPLKNGETYHLYVHALDKAGNEETTAEKEFMFRYDLSGPAPTPTPGPTATPEPTTQPTAQPTATVLLDTYLDPIPDHINALYSDDCPWITGTSIAAAGRDMDDVWIQIINSSNGYNWRGFGGGFWASGEYWNNASLNPMAWGNNQWDWEYYDTAFSTPPRAENLGRDLSYTVRVRAEDSDGYVDLSPAEDTFVYDDTDPGVSFSTVFTPVMYQDDIAGINGTAYDGTSGIAQVRLRIHRLDPPPYWWNGYSWSTNGTWVPAQGTTSWHIDQSTNPSLPTSRAALPSGIATSSPPPGPISIPCPNTPAPIPSSSIVVSSLAPRGRNTRRC